MNLTLWITFLAAVTVLVVSPGALVFLTISNAMTSGAPRSLLCTLGAVTANAILWVLTLTGLSALLLTSLYLYTAVKLVGAAYLVYLGISMWRSSFQYTQDAHAVRAAVAKTNLRLFTEGFLTGVSNPKDIIFLLTFLPQFMDANRSLAIQGSIMFLTQCFVAFAVMSVYAYAAQTLRHRITRGRIERVTNRVLGTVMIGAGAGLAAYKH
jgi:homoserine/homoserine lactone efflux protein